MPGAWVMMRRPVCLSGLRCTIAEGVHGTPCVVTAWTLEQHHHRHRACRDDCHSRHSGSGELGYLPNVLPQGELSNIGRLFEPSDRSALYGSCNAASQRHRGFSEQRNTASLRRKRFLRAGNWDPWHHVFHLRGVGSGPVWLVLVVMPPGLGIGGDVLGPPSNCLL